MINHIRTKSDEVAIAQGCYFDAALAERELTKIQTLFRVKLYQWQRDCLWLYFGWRSKDGGYRFSEIRLWIPKKNGKSYLLSTLIGYKLFELREARIFSAACTAQQAKIILGQVLTMFRTSPQIAKHMHPRTGKIKGFCTPFRRDITNGFTNSSYYALAKGKGSNDGLIPDVIVIDEIHQMDNAQIDIIDNSTANNPHSLKVILSTAGSGDKGHRSWQKYEYTKQVLSGEVIDTRLLPIVYEVSDGDYSPDDLYSEKLLVACNPVLAEFPDRLEAAKRELVEAKQLRNDSNWKRYRLNIWCATDGELFVAPEQYHANEVPSKAEGELGGCEVYVGIDKGGVWDFSAVCLLFRLPDGKVYEKHYTFAVADRLPRMAEEDEVDYAHYATDGELTIIPAGAVADDFLSGWLLTELKKYAVRRVGADPWQAGHQVETLTANGFDVLQVNQSNLRLLTPVIEDYADRVRRGGIIHPKNGLYLWQLGCARKITTAKDCVKIVKAGSNRLGRGGSGHIDNIDAAINALAVLRQVEIQEAAYGSSGMVIG